MVQETKGGETIHLNRLGGFGFQQQTRRDGTGRDRTRSAKKIVRDDAESSLVFVQGHGRGYKNEDAETHRERSRLGSESNQGSTAAHDVGALRVKIFEGAGSRCRVTERSGVAARVISYGPTSSFGWRLGLRPG